MPVTIFQPGRPGSQAIELETSFEQYGDLNPWFHHLELRVAQGELKQGDQVHVICGDQSGRFPGWRQSTPTPVVLTRRAETNREPNA